MKTQIIFGTPKEECKTELFLLNKGSWSSVKEGIESKLNGKAKNQVGGDLFTKPNAPSNITMWHELNDNQYQQVILAQYENKLSRNMGHIRSDVIQKEIAKHIPSTGDASVTICVKDKKVCHVFFCGTALTFDLPRIPFSLVFPFLNHLFLIFLGSLRRWN